MCFPSMFRFAFQVIYEYMLAKLVSDTTKAFLCLATSKPPTPEVEYTK